jgi:anti-sigma B factor antagonist
MEYMRPDSTALDGAGKVVKMKLTQKEVRGVTVIEVHGKLIGGPDNSDLFHDCIASLLEDGKNRIVVDLHRTLWANSQGIGLLIGAHTAVTNAGGNLVLTRVIDRIHDILTVTRLLLIFKTFEGVEEAVGYMLGESKGEQDTHSKHKHLRFGGPFQTGLDHNAG